MHRPSDDDSSSTPASEKHNIVIFDRKIPVTFALSAVAAFAGFRLTLTNLTAGGITQPAPANVLVWNFTGMTEGHEYKLEMASVDADGRVIYALPPQTLVVPGAPVQSTTKWTRINGVTAIWADA